MRTALMVPRARPPSGFRARGRVVCSCHGVAEHEIAAAIAAQCGPARARCSRVQDELRCGTGCGSCVPELKQIVAAQHRSSRHEREGPLPSANQPRSAKRGG